MKETYGELDATVVYSFKEGNAHVDFSAYEVVARESNNGRDYDIPCYEGIGGCGADDKMTTDTDKANKYIHGTITWDGCSHIYFGSEEGYIHLCGSRNFKNISDLLLKIYNRCYEIGGFDYDPLTITP